MNAMNTVSGLAQQPYSANELLGLIFLIQAFLFLIVNRRTGASHFRGMGIGMLLASIAWGTTQFQSVGEPYVTWDWFWAQPFFTGAVVAIGVALMSYLPLTERERHWLTRIIWGPVLTYLLVLSVLTLLDVKVLRLWIIVVQLPAIVGAGLAALWCERREPRMGHLLIGLSLLSMPVMTVLVAVSGAQTLVLRFWTGLPTVLITTTMLTISHLRDRKKLIDEVTRRRQAEDQLAQTNADLERKVQERTADLRDMVQGLESFNRNISHDLRGPLGGIDMLAFVAERHIEQGQLEEARTQIRLISDQVRQSHSTVDALLSLASTIDRQVRLEPIELNEVAQTAMKEAVLTVQSRNPGRALPRVMVGELGQANTDRDLLRIILVNLISNALKFNIGQAGTEVCVNREPALAGTLILVVSDNGIGFDTADAQRAFEPFQRLQGTRNIPGYGLGLAIVRRAVERLGGHISVLSAPGQGASMRITLPGTLGS
jgi:signal transduction histidine kinase